MEHVTINSVIEYLDNLKLHFVIIPGYALTRLNDEIETGKFNQRLLIRVEKQEKWQGGVVALGEGDGYIAISAARMKKMNLQRGDKVTVDLEPDTSEYGHAFPEELEEVLRQDLEAHKRFHAMSMGKQRTIIYYINQVKSSDKRIERSLLFMSNLKTCIPGKETMREIFGKK